MTGLDANERRTIQTVLSNYAEVETAILYGSRATDRFRPGSDVDILLTGQHLTHRTVLDILSDFDDSDLPYIFDIVTENSLDADVKKEIDKTGKIFYERTHL
jgi:predicted nucleotidyltransferase